MTLATMQPLDTLTFPLSGASLIEASAGTGKTYTIVNLYLRLLLGHGCAPLSVEQILVVTFTNAATGELKERIRQRLREAYLDFFAQTSQDPFTQQLIEQSDNIELDCQRLALASKQMDEASVYTIHGFCHKSLTEHAFESGAMYDQSFILDQSEWLQMAAEDYWRKHLVTLPPQTLELLIKQWSTPEAMLKDLKSLIDKPATPYQTCEIDTAINSVEQYAQQVAKLKNWWLSNEVSQQLTKANLSGRAKLAKLPLLQNMQAFCKGTLLQIDFDKAGWQLFFPEQVAKAAKKGSEDLSHLDFSQFEQLQSKLVSCQQNLKLAFSQHAINVVSANLQSNKQRLDLLSPDDLLLGLQRALQQTSDSTNTSALAQCLRQSFPVALIDEFQDTDPVQFEVFKGIYGSTEPQDSHLCWIMIGDPKQAVYAFRGADIFTYISAKQWVPSERHFTLAKNWRSAPELVHAINQLFQRSDKGFLFEQSIPFYPVEAGRDFAGLMVNGQAVQSLNFQHLCSEQNLPIPASQATDVMAISTANQIAEYLQLAQSGDAMIKGRVITAGDCCVLVRNRNEAQNIKQALAKVNVASVFLARKSVFATQVALDLLRLLKALSQPTDERLMKTALMSELFTFTAEHLDQLFNDESDWQTVLELLGYWHQTWQKQGLMRAINQVLVYFDVEQGLLKHQQDGLRRITDLRHLTELLQQQSMQLVGETQLIHWFENCVLQPDHNNGNQQMRLESDANLVQIITLHSSKGLEFPLVFIPFASNYKAAQQALYHNDTQQLEVDFLVQEPNLQKADFERLAEDIRLFYVAVTRAIYYCSIGVWNIGASKKVSGFGQSALGSLLLTSDTETPGDIDDKRITQSIQSLANNCKLAYQAFTQVQPSRGLIAQVDDTQNQTLIALQLTKPVTRQWRLTSYSAISSQQAHLDMPAPGQDEGQDQPTIAADLTVIDSSNSLAELVQSPFSFERGANAGSFLHGVLENIDLQQSEQLPEAIAQQSTGFGIDETWHQCVELWLRDMLLASLCVDAQPSSLCLAQLSPQQIKVEMEFHMPLHQVRVKDFNKIINRYFKQQSRDYQFEQLNGMIKGFIDLMFEFEGKYYVADYKSNYLGDSYSHYNQSAMEHAMTDHDYHLQAILYTLALHRWLKHKLANYDYQRHIGGAYYLFIRGMSQNEPGSGVYYFVPEQSMIEKLDDLFAGKTPAIDTDCAKTNTAQNPQGQLDLW
jgi:exodeoxyribonuclease V beta subunit